MEDLWEKEMYGGTASSGFIQAMMAKESKNPDVHSAFNTRIEKHNAKISKKQAKGDKRVRKGKLTKNYVNEHKFQSMEEWDIDRMSKATHDLIRHKELTVEQAIKAFYAWLLAEAKQHEPLRDTEIVPPINYRGTYDITPKFDQWKEEAKVVVKEEKKEEKEEVPEGIIPLSKANELVQQLLIENPQLTEKGKVIRDKLFKSIRYYVLHDKPIKQDKKGHNYALRQWTSSNHKDEMFKEDSWLNLYESGIYKNGKWQKTAEQLAREEEYRQEGERKQREKEERESAKRKVEEKGGKWSNLIKLINKYEDEGDYRKMTDAEKRTFVKEWKKYQDSDEEEDEDVPYLPPHLQKLSTSLRFQ